MSRMELHIGTATIFSKGDFENNLEKLSKVLGLKNFNINQFSRDGVIDFDCVVGSMTGLSCEKGFTYVIDRNSETIYQCKNREYFEESYVVVEVIEESDGSLRYVLCFPNNSGGISDAFNEGVNEMECRNV